MRRRTRISRAGTGLRTTATSRNPQRPRRISIGGRRRRAPSTGFFGCRRPARSGTTGWSGIGTARSSSGGRVATRPRGPRSRSASGRRSLGDRVSRARDGVDGDHRAGGCRPAATRACAHAAGQAKARGDASMATTVDDARASAVAGGEVIARVAVGGGDRSAVPAVNRTRNKRGIYKELTAGTFLTSVDMMRSRTLTVRIARVTIGFP